MDGLFAFIMGHFINGPANTGDGTRSLMTYLLVFILGLAQAASYSLTASGPASGLLQILSLAGLFYFWLVSKSPVRLTLAFGLGWLGVGLYWIYFSMHDIGGLPAPLSVLALALLGAVMSGYYMVAAWLFRRFCRGRGVWRSVLGLPSVWLLAELARGYVFTGFPWLIGGYAQIDNPLLNGWFAVLGTYGVGFLAAFLAATLVWSAVHWRNIRTVIWPVMAALALMSAGLIVQGLHWGTPMQSPMTVRMVQPNILQSTKFEADSIQTNTETFIRQSTESTAPLTVYPETVVPVAWIDLPEEMRASLKNTLAAQNRTVLIGSLGVDLAQRKVYNSGLWLNGESDMDNPARYDKSHLLPFGEVVPWGFQWFVDVMNIPLGGFSRGEGYTPFELTHEDGTIRVGVNICYENEFGEELITAWRNGDAAAPNVWVNMTNLAWFGNHTNSPMHMQHLIMSRARALEMARPVLVVTNTGLSANIDAMGHVVDLLPADEAAIKDVQIQGHSGMTPYIRWGNTPMFAWLIAFFAGLMFIKRGQP